MVPLKYLQQPLDFPWTTQLWPARASRPAPAPAPGATAGTPPPARRAGHAADSPAGRMGHGGGALAYLVTHFFLQKGSGERHTL